MDNKIQIIETIVKKYDISVFKKELVSVKMFRDNYNVKIVMMGSFNAGKSALINKLIDRNVLIEAQKPQTTIATELYYTEGKEKIVAIDTTNNKENEFTILEQESISAEKYDKAMMYLNNDVIRTMSDAVVVDMPGYDSGVFNHNKAIAKYIGESNIYFYIKPASLTGGLDNNDLSHIKELMMYGGNVVLVISKIDLLNGNKDNLDKIACEVRNTLEVNFLDIPIYFLSREDADIKEKAFNIISDFDIQAVFNKNLSKVISSLAESIKNQLEVLRSNVDEVNRDEYENKIYELEKQKKKIVEDFERKKKSGKNSLICTGVERVCSQVNSALKNCRGRLISAIKNNADSETLSAIVSESIRPIMCREMNNELGIQVNDIIDSIYCDIKCEGKEDIGHLLTGIAHKTKDVLESDTLKNFAESIDKYREKKKNSSAGAVIYKGATGVLAAATSFLAPPIEIIIILLPEIIKLGQMIFGESTEDKIAQLIDDSYFPEVRRRLRESIEDYMAESYNNLISVLSEEFSDQIDEITSHIESINSSMCDSEMKIAQYISELNCDIETLNGLILAD